jgi:hypothetical protein
MRILLDECLPEGLRYELTGHQVRIAREAGLAALAVHPAGARALCDDDTDA